MTTIIAKVQNLTYMYELNEIIGLKKQNIYIIQKVNGKVETKMVVEYIPIEEVDKDNKRFKQEQ